jgi:hypothetical protein
MVFAPFNSFCRRYYSVLLTIHCTEYHFMHVTVFFDSVTEISFFLISRWRSNKTSINVKHQGSKLKAYGFVYSNPRSSHWSLPVTSFTIVIASLMRFNTNLPYLAIMCHAAGCIMFRILQKLR